MMIIEPEKPLTIQDLVNVSVDREDVELSANSINKIAQSNKRLESIVKKGKPVYGINTGFGIFANRTINATDTERLNRNLIISHSVGTGRPLDEYIVRGAMLIRAATLAKGYSGVRPIIIQTLIEMLNKGVTPIIPEKGSLGSSGDLCQLSHMALVLSTDHQDSDEDSGSAIYRGRCYSGKKAMQLAGIDRVILKTKEGLALNNGATFSAAILAFSLHEAEYLVNVSEYATALSMEALCARSTALDERIHFVRNQPGQINTASNIRKLVDGSQLLDSYNQVQDAYSIRCAPQVIGAVRDSLLFIKRTIESEINAVTDNPLIFEPAEAISGGNFHGEPVGLTSDFLSIAMCEVGALSERRIFRLTDEKMNNGLPPMLVEEQKDAGLNSGLMMPQYTAASLVLENQTLATPDSIKSLPTSAGQEDHNANAMTAARHAYEIVENIRQILSIELYTATRALNIRDKQKPIGLGNGTRKIFDQINSLVGFIAGDTLWGREIEKVNKMLREHLLKV